MRRPLIVAIALVVLLGIAGVVAFQFALQRLHRGIEQALGPRASVGAIEVQWPGVQLRDLRVRGEAGWPAADELRADRVVVVPALGSLFGGGWRVRSVQIDGAYLSLLRTRDGRLRLLPSLLPEPAPAPRTSRAAAKRDVTAAASAPASGAVPPIVIETVHLDGGAIEFFDASIRQPPHKLRLESLQATAGPLHVPALDQPVALALKGRFKGRANDGDLDLGGHLTPSTTDGELKLRLRDVDLVALQPYLLRAADSGVRRGRLDLQIDATTKARKLHAPGRVTLTDLELASGSGLSTFAGVPRQAVLAAMSRDGRISLQFSLDGSLDDPSFSLNDTLALRLAAGLAEKVGVSVSGVVEGVGSMVRGLLGR